MSVLGGIDIAHWDLKGKAEGKPASELAGATRDSGPAYTSGLLWKRSIRELADEARRHASEEFLAMKMRLGRSRDYDCEALAAVRAAIGPGRRLMVDGNARYSLEEARSMIPRFEEVEVFWLEEPFAPEDLDSFIALQPTRGSIRSLRARTNSACRASPRRGGLPGGTAKSACGLLLTLGATPWRSSPTCTWSPPNVIR